MENQELERVARDHARAYLIKLRQWIGYPYPKRWEDALVESFLSALKQVNKEKVGDNEIRQWASRHDLQGSLTDLRCIFEDARTLSATPQNVSPENVEREDSGDRINKALEFAEWVQANMQTYTTANEPPDWVAIEAKQRAGVLVAALKRVPSPASTDSTNKIL